ncbi:MAG: DUF3802 family protein [Colwellia sp.]|nr:DUF3802 family protein [Colwellia sp.]MCW8866263.1 DUF3802 family protein [Colwellia sp.]MCW9082806.1 DUF3802 family protein [Colwellia sp.]
MVTDTEGYVQIIEYLTEHLSFFENSSVTDTSKDSIIAVIEQELSEQIITVCSQNEKLSFNQRNEIVREVDAIVYDLEEIFSGVINNPATEQQCRFIKEFASLIKNLFDSEIHEQLAQNS